ATLCHLRGIIYQNLNSIDRAKEAFVDALMIDVKCYESFEALMKGNMLTGQEEWDLLQQLAYSEQVEDDADYVKMMYTIRLKKYGHRQEMSTARQKLVTTYGLSSNPDVLLGLAEELLTSYRYAECYTITSKQRDHQATLALHLACMVKLPHLRSKLFVLAHELVERDPDLAVSWYAVGLWYYSGSRWDEARRFFSKSVLLDSRYGPSWLCYAHCFAHEGEHDQAMTAYMTAQRNMMGNHLPTLFLGMQNMTLGNYHIADQYLKLAYDLNQDDPLLLNEMGVLAYRDERYSIAIQLFHSALRAAAKIQSPMSNWKEVLFNAGQAYRKIGKLDEAKTFLRKCVDMDPRWPAPLAALGMTLHLAGETPEAIQRYHEALAVAPADVIINKLLEQALEDIADDTLPPHLARQSDRGPFHIPGLAHEVEKRLTEDVEAAEKDNYKEVLGLDDIHKKLSARVQDKIREYEQREGRMLHDPPLNPNASTDDRMDADP
ncbi:TPR-like protein, partial [Atractiella rhizophila]